MTTGDPRAPSVVFKSLQTQGLQVECARLLRTAQPHTVSPSTRPCSSSEELRASVQLLPRIFHRPASRPSGVQDTRCVQPTSATRTTLLHPHLAHSQLALPTCAGRTLRGVSSLRAVGLGGRTFHDVRTASADLHRTRFPLSGASRAEAVTDLVRRRGRFLPTVPDAIEPLTSLSPPTLSLGLTGLRPCSLFRVSACDLLGAPAGPLGE